MTVVRGGRHLLGAFAIVVTSGTSSSLLVAQGTLSVSGDPASLVVTSAAPGASPNAVTNASTTYSVTVLSLGLGITGQLNAAMPANTFLSAALAAPSGASSLGDVTLGTTAQTLVRNLQLGAYSGLGITYTFRADETAGVIGTTSRTVTLTLAAVP